MRADQRRLLEDVLSETLSPDFADELLAQTLKEAGRRCRYRAFRRGAACLGAAAVVAGMLLVGVFLKVRGRVAVVATEAACPVVHTTALTSDQLVQTRLLAAVAPVTTFVSVNVVTTTPTSGGYRRLGDAELLALLMRHPAALVRLGAQPEKLIFLDPSDSDEFPVN